MRCSLQARWDRELIASSQNGGDRIFHDGNDTEGLGRVGLVGISEEHLTEVPAALSIRSRLKATTGRRNSFAWFSRDRDGRYEPTDGAVEGGIGLFGIDLDYVLASPFTSVGQAYAPCAADGQKSTTGSQEPAVLCS
jgi:hypothetical protein